ncbi:MAG: DUF4203 domain-containing protein [Ilumatobacteraceae bacterium]
MNDIIVGLIALLTGAVFCFRGYLAMRIVIPVWGAFAGFFLGAGLVAGDSGFLGTTLGWVVGLGLALVFGVIAYLYYAVSVVIGMMAIGFVLGTTLVAALGVTWSWVIVLSGVVLAIALSIVAILGDLPMVLLTVLTALAGASAMVSGLMLLFGVYDTGDYSSALTTRFAADDWWWYAIYGGLVVAGLVAQFSDVERRNETLREAWSSSPTMAGSTNTSARNA